jgi:hypothetical protein
MNGERQSRLQDWAVRSPDWAVDARFMAALPLVFLGLLALLISPWLALLCLGMLLGLVFALSLEPISGVVILIIGPALAYFFWGSEGLVPAGLFLLLLIFLGFLWTLRSARFEARRAQRVSGKKRQSR